jgi:hypothetical protein
MAIADAVIGSKLACHLSGRDAHLGSLPGVPGFTARS